MTDLSVRIFLQAELQRLREWLTDEPALDDVDTIPTIGDRIKQTDIDSRLPDGWCIERDIVQFEGESLAEVVRLTDSGDGYQITLKPVAMEAPTETVEIYSRRSPFESRHHRTTVDSLSTAVAAAERIASNRESSETRSRPRQATTIVDREL